MLIENGALIAPTNRGGDTAVGVAAAQGFAPVLEQLLGHVEAQGCQDVVGKANERGLYPLHAAASNGSAECCKYVAWSGVAWPHCVDHGAGPWPWP